MEDNQIFLNQETCPVCNGEMVDKSAGDPESRVCMNDGCSYLWRSRGVPSETTKRLKELQTRARRLEKAREALDIEHGYLEGDIQDELASLHEVERDMLWIGGWECKKSAIGVCYYDTEIDPCQDHCLVCGHPRERK